MPVTGFLRFKVMGDWDFSPFDALLGLRSKMRMRDWRFSGSGVLELPDFASSYRSTEDGRGGSEMGLSGPASGKDEEIGLSGGWDWEGAMPWSGTLTTSLASAKVLGLSSKRVRETAQEPAGIPLCLAAS